LLIVDTIRLTRRECSGDFPEHSFLRRKDDLKRLLAVVVEAEVSDGVFAHDVSAGGEVHQKA
jgi:hypothetical protein